MRISDVKLHLTQTQYKLLIGLSQSIPRVLATTSNSTSEAESSLVPTPVPTTEPKQLSSPDQPVDLQPELRTHDPDVMTWPTLELTVHMNVVKLHLYDQQATSEVNRKEHGIARFALNNSSLRYKILSSGAAEAQVVLKSFTMSNTRPGASRFREIIPAAGHDRNQFMVLYTSSGGLKPSSLVIATIDSPQVIFSIDPVFALADYFLSAFPPSQESADTDAQASDAASGPASTLDYRVDLHDLSVIVLEDDAKSDTRAISLSIRQILLSQQVSEHRSKAS